MDRGNPIANCETTQHWIREIAEDGSRRLVRVGRANVARMWELADAEDLAAVCPTERHMFGLGPDCRDWKALQR